MLCDDVIELIMVTFQLHTLKYVKCVSHQFLRCARRTIHTPGWLNMGGDGETEITHETMPNFNAMMHAVQGHWVTCRLPTIVHLEIASPPLECVLHDIAINDTHDPDDEPLPLHQRLTIASICLEIASVGIFSSVDELCNVLPNYFTHSAFRLLDSMIPYLRIGGSLFPFEPNGISKEVECTLLHGAVTTHPPVIVRSNGGKIYNRYEFRN